MSFFSLLNIALYLTYRYATLVDECGGGGNGNGAAVVDDGASIGSNGDCANGNGSNHSTH